MDFVRKVVNASSLASIITLPQSLMNQKLEIIVLPTGEKENSVQENSVKAGIAYSLLGAISADNMDIEKIKEERLNKYEVTD